MTRSRTIFILKTGTQSIYAPYDIFPRRTGIFRQTFQRRMDRNRITFPLTTIVTDECNDTSTINISVTTARMGRANNRT